MTDTQPNQAMPNDAHKGDDQGVEHPGGKTAGGESSGGAYPNPHTGKPGDQGDFMGHGGQSEQDYSGGDGGEENAATGAE